MTCEGSFGWPVRSIGYSSSIAWNAVYMCKGFRTRLAVGQYLIFGVKHQICISYGLLCFLALASRCYSSMLGELATKGVLRFGAIAA